MARLQISDGVLEMRLVPLFHTVEHRGRVTAEQDFNKRGAPLLVRLTSTLIPGADPAQRFAFRCGNVVRWIATRS